MDLTPVIFGKIHLQAEGQPRTTFGPMSSAEQTNDPLYFIISVVVLLVFSVIGYYVSRYFRNHRSKK